MSLDRVFREMEALNRRLNLRQPTSGAGGTTAPGLAVETLPAGAAVLDLVTGEQGVILGRSTAHIVVPPAERRND
jgi:hypothetical protein